MLLHQRDDEGDINATRMALNTLNANVILCKGLSNGIALPNDDRSVIEEVGESVIVWRNESLQADDSMKTIC